MKLFKIQNSEEATQPRFSFRRVGLSFLGSMVIALLAVGSFGASPASAGAKDTPQKGDKLCKAFIIRGDEVRVARNRYIVIDPGLSCNLFHTDIDYASGTAYGLVFKLVNECFESDTPSHVSDVCSDYGKRITQDDYDNADGVNLEQRGSSEVNKVERIFPAGSNIAPFWKHRTLS